MLGTILVLFGQHQSERSVRLVHGCWGQCVNTAFSGPRLNCRNHVLYVGEAARLAVPCLMCHLCAGHFARASCPNALHAVYGYHEKSCEVRHLAVTLFFRH